MTSSDAETDSKPIIIIIIIIMTLLPTSCTQHTLSLNHKRCMTLLSTGLHTTHTILHSYIIIIIIIIIMGLDSVSASEDVIGDLPSPWATINS